jgi:transcriptional regulator with GAF, ATPase, and Fis domain
MNAKPSTLVIAGDYLSPQVNSRSPQKNGLQVFRARDGESGLAHLRGNSAEAVIANENYFNIVQESGVMKKVCSLIADLARTDSTVLIQGETGTGKEMIAKAIHHSSGRKDRPMIGFSCAALSATLIESELFGHEKGAFTGALKTRAGRFEQADGGTLFLDEVGEMPLELQVKLLRVLQEKQFERVGGNETIKVDVRIITATNKDLRRAIREGKFREDLFYRLNVVLIQAPPLRERLEDVPPLAFHFLQECARRSNKEIGDIENEAVQLLLTQPWPGNIRELQNVIERSVVLEKGSILTRNTIASCLNAGAPPHEPVALFREDLPYHQAKDELLNRFDRDYIVTLLKTHGGNITRAAFAARLGYRNFYEKMKRLGINKWEFKKD